MTDDIIVPSSAHSGRRIGAVALVGFMGAGKSTVGEALARRLGWRFADLDRIIEKRAGRAIEQIFRNSGEAGFRELEIASLAEIVHEMIAKPFVLALGGGAFTQPDVRKLLLDSGVATVFLDGSVETLFRRCDQPGVVRPLRGDIGQFRELYETRRKSYCEAEIRVDTSNKDVDSVVEEIMSALTLTASPGVHQ